MSLYEFIYLEKLFRVIFNVIEIPNAENFTLLICLRFWNSSSPSVDRHAFTGAEIRNKPEVISFSSHDHCVNAPKIVEGSY